MKTLFLYGALALIIGFSMVVGSFDERRDDNRFVNPFHFENVTNLFIKYVNEKSKTMLKECGIEYTKMPNVFLCLKEKYEENENVKSKDPKKVFIGLLQLMNTSAACFSNVTMSEGLCLLKNKEEMEKTVIDKWIYFERLMNQILQSCNATSEMVKCVDDKNTRLETLAKTMMNNPDLGETIWNLGDSLKTCLTSNPTIEKCVLNKDMSSGKSWRRYGHGSHHNMHKSIKETSLKLLGDCKLTLKSTPDVFLCLKNHYQESNFASLQDPKQKFMNTMRLINASAVCYENVTDEQKACLSEKKKEVEEMIYQKMKVLNTVMDKILSTCNVSESQNPEIFNCITPKRTELEKMVPQLFNSLDIAEPVWNLMEDMKRCFDSKPEIVKCIEGKSKYVMSKFGANTKYVSKSEVIRRLKMMLPNCNISMTTKPVLYECLKPLENKLVGMIYRTDMDMAAKLKELQKMHISGVKCMVPSDNETTNCLAKQGKPLKAAIIRVFQKKSSKFDPKSAMASMDAMLGGCNITREKTPKLMLCLDERTKVVMELKPWLPMSSEVREKLKEEGRKYWKCFEDEHTQEKACMFKIIEGFKKLGKKKSVARTKIGSILSNDYIKNIINATVSKVMSCSKNQCFHKRMQKGVELFKAYLKQILMNVTEEGKNNTSKRLRNEMMDEVVGAILCLRKDNISQTPETFSCFMNVLNETMQAAKNISKEMGIINNKEENVSQRKKRDAEDDAGTLDLSIFTFLTGDTNTDNDKSSIMVFQILFNDQSMEQVQSMILLMRAFISTCTSWAPPPEDIRSRNLFPDSKPVDMVDGKSQHCRLLYDKINSFINTGKFNLGKQPKDHHHDEKKSHWITAATVGSVIVVISVLFSVIVAVIARRRCSSKRCNTSCGTSPSAPPQACPSVYTAFPSNMPPSYNETLDTEKYHPSSLSQILTTSTKEGTEKSC